MFKARATSDLDLNVDLDFYLDLDLNLAIMSYDSALSELYSAQESLRTAQLQLQEELTRKDWLVRRRADVDAEAKEVAHRTDRARHQMADVEDKMAVLARAAQCHADSRRRTEEELLPAARARLREERRRRADRAEALRGKLEERRKVEAEHMEVMRAMPRFPAWEKRRGLEAEVEAVREEVRALENEMERADKMAEDSARVAAKDREEKLSEVDRRVRELMETKEQLAKELKWRQETRAKKKSLEKQIGRDQETREAAKQGQKFQGEGIFENDGGRSEEPPPETEARAMRAHLEERPLDLTSPVKTPSVNPTLATSQQQPKKPFSLVIGGGGKRLSLPSIRRQDHDASANANTVPATKSTTESKLVATAKHPVAKVSSVLSFKKTPTKEPVSQSLPRRTPGKSPGIKLALSSGKSASTPKPSPTKTAQPVPPLLLPPPPPQALEVPENASPLMSAESAVAPMGAAAQITSTAEEGAPDFVPAMDTSESSAVDSAAAVTARQEPPPSQQQMLSQVGCDLAQSQTQANPPQYATLMECDNDQDRNAGGVQGQEEEEEEETPTQKEGELPAGAKATSFEFAFARGDAATSDGGGGMPGGSEGGNKEGGEGFGFLFGDGVGAKGQEGQGAGKNGGGGDFSFFTSAFGTGGGGGADDKQEKGGFSFNF